MPDTIRCPACGQENSAASPTCSRCHQPLQREATAAGAPAPDEPVIFLRRPVRRPRPQPVFANPMVLWGSVALVVLVALFYSSYTGFQWRRAAPIPGATPGQQRLADSLRFVLRRDSTNVAALIACGNIFYDTANWQDAAHYYGRALARDSNRIQALVDLGVCTYNQSDAARAGQFFELALRRAPGHAVALFNLGYVKERTGDEAGALRDYRQSLDAGASGATRQAVLQGMQRIRERAGRSPLRPAAAGRHSRRGRA